MMKQTFGILFSTGLIILAGCTRQTEVMNAAPINLDASIAQAGAEHKIVLMDFTGSDWCAPCMALHHDILARPEFEAYAQSNLVFLTVDFPRDYQLPPDSAATNDWLSKKFDVEGFPTLIALDSHGNKIWQQVGLEPGYSLKKFIATLDAVKAKAK